MTESNDTFCSGAVPAVAFPGPPPGAAWASCEAGLLVLENNVLRGEWTVAEGRLRPIRFVDRLSGAELDLRGAECFQLALDRAPRRGLERVPAGSLRLDKVHLERLLPVPGAVRAADGFPGWGVQAFLGDEKHGFGVIWTVALRDGANYVRFGVRPMTGRAIPIQEIVLLDWPIPEARLAGRVSGSPVLAGTWFLGVEHPLARNEVVAPSELENTPQVRGTLSGLIRHPGRSVEGTAVVGVAPAGQSRRAFLYYLERERAQPYRQYLHYNNGYEIGCEYWKRKNGPDPSEALTFRRHQERLWLAYIQAFGRELAEARNVALDGFVHDFMWDDEDRVWEFNEGYPEGFGPAREEAERWGAGLGVWLSPWGGYPGKPARLRAGRALGFLTTDQGLTLACPRYFARFWAACTEMIRRYGVGYFKFDGFGAGNNQPGPAHYATDVEALLDLSADLRQLRPDVLVNPSTGSWPSPFWLRWADVIWRQGSDSSEEGKGSERQRWITYRDAATYQGIVQRAPLYPLSALMLHGVFINRAPFAGNPFDPANPDPVLDPGDIAAEIRSFFATGTALQELYIHPELLTPAMWDTLAEAAAWARANADVLADTHWIGGNPAELEVYGWASWNCRQGILTLRNPDDRPQGLELCLREAFELPAAAPRSYRLASPWREDEGKPALELTAEERHRFELQPFEVLVLEATPVTEEGKGRAG